jgi:hypothetical protein
MGFADPVKKKQRFENKLVLNRRHFLLLIGSAKLAQIRELPSISTH